jgi:CTP synthase (UTP-ammonia lyase)
MIRLLPGTIASQAYGIQQASEQFACNYGLNPNYHELLFQGDLKATGYGPDGEVRLLELVTHPFYIGTLFLPQVTSTPERPHPLILAFMEAAKNSR